MYMNANPVEFLPILDYSSWKIVTKIWKEFTHYFMYLMYRYVFYLDMLVLIVMKYVEV